MKHRQALLGSSAGLWATSRPASLLEQLQAAGAAKVVRQVSEAAKAVDALNQASGAERTDE